MKEQDTVNRLLSHLDVSAMMEVFVKLMSVVDSQEMKAKMETVSLCLIFTTSFPGCSYVIR